MVLNDDALYRAQMEISTAVRFQDVVAAVFANGLSLARAQGGALWLRESGFDESATAANEVAPRAIEQTPKRWIRVLDQALERFVVLTPESEKNVPSVVQAAIESGRLVIEENQGALLLLMNERVAGVLHLCWDEAPKQIDEALMVFCKHAAIEMANTRSLEQMENAKREWETTFDGMIDGICVEDKNGAVLRANATMARLFEFESSQVPGLLREDWPQLLAGYEELQPIAPMPHDHSGRGVRYGEFRCGTPPRVFAETVFELQLRDETDSGARSRLPSQREERRYLRVLRDISQQRRLEEQLIQSEKLAALGELVSGVAHELNNPLATVAGYAQLLQDDKSLPPSTRRQIEHIYEEASRASRIVGNLLSFARREEPRNELLDVEDALRSVVQLRSYQLVAANISVEENYARVPLVRGDSGQLQQVFLNVINNAQGAMDVWRGGGVLKISTQPADVGNERGVLIAFEDNGPGIAPDSLRRIFDPFWTTKPAGEGTGLGMSISLGIVSRHGGRIWAESTIGKGARFFIELPGALGNEDDDIEYSMSQPRDENVLEERPSSKQNGARILIVDDEEPVILLIGEVLSLDGHETTPAFNGGEALALLQERDFDLILSDVRMPAVGGPTFFEILQTTRPDLLPRVVFVTGDTMSPSTQQFLQRANRPVMAKPFDPERLRALVRDQLEQNKDES